MSIERLVEQRVRLAELQAKLTPKIVTDMHESLDRHGYDYDIFNIARLGTYCRISPLPAMRAQVWADMAARGWSLESIARISKAADHSTVMEAIRRHEERVGAIPNRRRRNGTAPVEAA